MLLTSQIKVKRSCHLAFLGNRVLDPTYATRPRVATAAKELAEVLVKSCGDVVVSSMMMLICTSKWAPILE